MHKYSSEGFSQGIFCGWVPIVPVSYILCNSIVLITEGKISGGCMFNQRKRKDFKKQSCSMLQLDCKNMRCG